MLNHKKFEELLANLDMKLDLYIHGPTGSGKTVGVSNAAKKLNLPFYKKVVGSTMSEASILGYNMGNEYIEGIAYRPFVEGGILLLDEVDDGNANTNLLINGLSDGELAFPCGMRERHKDFRLVTTANTLGQGPSLNYVGRNKQDVSLLNRLVFIYWPYDIQLTYDFCVDIIFDGQNDAEKKERQLNQFNQIWTDVEKMQQIIEEIKIPHIISPRTMKQVAIKVKGDRSMEEILNSVILKGLTKEQKQRILEMMKNKRSKLENLPKFQKNISKEAQEKEQEEQEKRLKAVEKEIEELQKLQEARERREEEEKKARLEALYVPMDEPEKNDPRADDYSKTLEMLEKSLKSKEVSVIKSIYKKE